MNKQLSARSQRRLRLTIAKNLSREPVSKRLKLVTDDSSSDSDSSPEESEQSIRNTTDSKSSNDDTDFQRESDGSEALTPDSDGAGFHRECESTNESYRKAVTPTFSGSQMTPEFRP